MEPDTDQLCGNACTSKAHEVLKKAQKKKWCNTILERWYKDDLYRKSLSDIGWIEEGIMQYDNIALEDHSYTATREERSRNENSWKLSLNAEGVQGPFSAVRDAKQTCKRLYHEHTAITGSGNKPITPEQQVRQRRNQQFEGLEEHAYRLDASIGWRYYPSSTTHSSSSSSSRWQPSSDLWSAWN